jgi:hypothetical protein
MRKELGLLGAGVVVLLLGIWFTSSFGVHPALALAAAALILVAFGFSSEFRLGHWMLAMLLVLHALVGYVELGTDSWIANITGTILDDRNYGLLLFIWTSSLMFALRFFAGPIVHQISPLGLLFVSAVLASLGLVMLGFAAGAIVCVIAATIYGFGKTFFWPTMLGVVSERFPKGGAITLGTIGGVGMLSAGILGGPGIGYKQDYFAREKLEQTSPLAYERYRSDDSNRFLFFPPISGLDGSKKTVLLGEAGENNGDGKLLAQDIANLESKGQKLSDNKNLDKLNNWWQSARQYADEDRAPVQQAVLFGGQMALLWTAAVPAAMALGYLLLILYFRMQGGYQQIHIDEHQAEKQLAGEYVAASGPDGEKGASEAIQSPSPVQQPPE